MKKYVTAVLREKEVKYTAGAYFPGNTHSPVVITSSNRLFFRIMTRPDCFNHTTQFRVYFRAVRKSLAKSLHVVHTSPTSGYIQPVGLVPGTSYGFSINSNAMYRLVLPAGHVVMTSLPQMRLVPPNARKCQIHLFLFSEAKGEGEKLIWKRCRLNNTTPEVYTTTLVIRFRGHPVESNCGFKFVYTFHSWVQSPQKMADGMFNCSVSYYQDFKEHVHCNLYQECEGREDEGGHCSFSNTVCDGSVATKNKCLHSYGEFFVVILSTSI